MGPVIVAIATVCFAPVPSGISMLKQRITSFMLVARTLMKMVAWRTNAVQLLPSCVNQYRPSTTCCIIRKSIVFTISCSSRRRTTDGSCAAVPVLL